MISPPRARPPPGPGPTPASPGRAAQSMYLVLVTNKASNILEDLETLRLCGKVVPEYVMPLEEENVSGRRASGPAATAAAAASGG